MAYTTIDDPSAYFQIDLYTGNGTAGTAYTFDGNSDLQPDFIWGSQRDEDGGARFVFDSSRGTTKRLKTDANTEEQTRSGVTAFGSDGFTMGDHADSNNNSETHVVWAWKANGGTTTTNDASATSVGSVDSVYQANTTSGFSIVTYTGTGSGDITLAHGLGKVPNLIIGKVRNQSYDWRVYHSSEGASKAIQLNGNGAAGTNNAWGGTTPTSTVFTVGRGSDENMNYGSGDTIVAYCFADIQGYSKFGSYTGNGNADGTFVYTGFKPAWIMAKRTDTAKNWYIADSKRSPINVNKAHLVANDTDAEDTSGDATDSYFDILSNGFKLRQDFSHLNADGGTFVYIAFAEHPFVSSEGVPTTAR